MEINRGKKDPFKWALENRKEKEVAEQGLSYVSGSHFLFGPCIFKPLYIYKYRYIGAWKYKYIFCTYKLYKWNDKGLESGRKYDFCAGSRSSSARSGLGSLQGSALGSLLPPGDSPRYCRSQPSECACAATRTLRWRPLRVKSGAAAQKCERDRPREVTSAAALYALYPFLRFAYFLCTLFTLSALSAAAGGSPRYWSRSRRWSWPRRPPAPRGSAAAPRSPRAAEIQHPNPHQPPLRAQQRATIPSSETVKRTPLPPLPQNHFKGMSRGSSFVSWSLFSISLRTNANKFPEKT